MVYISIQYFFYHIVIVYVRNYQNMVKKYCPEALHEKKKIEALHEITEFVHEMLSVCAPYNNNSNNVPYNNRGIFQLCFPSLVCFFTEFF